MNDPFLYHAYPCPGKMKTVPSKPLRLALGYSPGVAKICDAIIEDASAVDRFTIRGSLVAVISNGTAVLGLGDIGPLASKPVMEGKAVLFQEFAKLNAVSIEIEEKDPKKLVEIIASLEPSFGGINLEDIKAPECFYVEEHLKERLNIPVMHDDQHGTAITVAAAVLNALLLVKKSLQEVRCVVSGAGASAMACLRLLRILGMPLSHIFVCDTEGVVYKGRPGLSSYKAAYAQETEARHLADVMRGADLFLGLSRKGLVTQEMVASMAPNPIIFALANPDPEIEPAQILAVRDDAIIGSGRSDYPNQVNNLICFPYMFRGAMDVHARQISDGMMVACVHALSSLAQEGFVDYTGHYGGIRCAFSKDYFIPKPFDPRLLERLPWEVARAALESGLAKKGFCLSTYRTTLQKMAYRPLLAKILAHPKKEDPLFYILTGDRKRDQLLLTVAKNMQDFFKAVLIAEAEWLKGLDVEGMTCRDLSTFKPAKTDACLFGSYAMLPQKDLRVALYKRIQGDSAVFLCSAPKTMARSQVQAEALSGIEVLGWKAKAIELGVDVWPEDLESGVGYLPIDHTFPLCCEDTSGRPAGDILGFSGPFFLGSSWQVMGDVMSIADAIDLACFAQKV